jgi:elongation factor Ts
MDKACLEPMSSCLDLEPRDFLRANFCLLEQGFIKNPDVTVTDLIKTKIAELGENIVVRRFTRYAVGGE